MAFSTIRTVVATLMIGGLMPPALAMAECDNAERLRLEEEMRKLSQRNAWSGVERSYTSLEKMPGCVLPFEDYYLGGQSARYLGKVWEMYQRLMLAKEIDPQEGILDSLMGVDANYGRVDIKGSERRPPELTRGVMPFAPDQRKAIEWAQTVIENTGRFEGMLPAGDYDVGGNPFSVAAGQDFVEILVGKPPKAAKEPKVRDDSGKVVKGPKEPRERGPGLVIYKGPIASLGPNFMISPEPKKEVSWADGADQHEPGNLGFGGGLIVGGGGEIGFTKEFGVAISASYAGAYGTKTFHVISGWLAAAVRPGDLRLALGPTYGVITGKGTGVASWFDRGYDQRQYANDQLGYTGFSYGGGLQFTAGYGLVDLDPLQGVVELGAAFQHDGARSYFGFGLRVGIVPLIKRFKG
ncbi:MAG: hypothetical protein HN348_22770 [Proteobacteria bacterium]|jgi:hypothetical protein|nr:hypothetical protein [Pseudomonadota bacterium]